MFARVVTMRLKPNSTSHFAQAIERDVLPVLRKQKGFRDEITFVTQNGTEALGISLWETRDNAEAYERTGYPDVVRALNAVVEGSPQVRTYDVTNSTPHNISARAAA